MKEADNLSWLDSNILMPLQHAHLQMFELEHEPFRMDVDFRRCSGESPAGRKVRPLVCDLGWRLAGDVGLVKRCLHGK